MIEQLKNLKGEKLKELDVKIFLRKFPGSGKRKFSV